VWSYNVPGVGSSAAVILSGSVSDGYERCCR
jgi:hypothetical protein